MKRHFDHIDLRVSRLSDVSAFYETLLPALGFSRRVEIEGWLEFQALGERATEFFGVRIVHSCSQRKPDRFPGGKRGGRE